MFLAFAAAFVAFLPCASNKGSVGGKRGANGQSDIRAFLLGNSNVIVNFGTGEIKNTHLLDDVVKGHIDGTNREPTEREVVESHRGVTRGGGVARARVRLSFGPIEKIHWTVIFMKRESDRREIFSVFNQRLYALFLSPNGYFRIEAAHSSMVSLFLQIANRTSVFGTFSLEGSKKTSIGTAATFAGPMASRLQ